MTSIVKPEDLRPGDLINVIDLVNRRCTVIKVEEVEGDVYVLTDQGVYVSGVSRSIDGTRTWELIERPRPEAKFGSAWIDPATGVKFIALDDGLYVSQFGTRYNSTDEDDARLIARLIARLVPAEEEA